MNIDLYPTFKAFQERLLQPKQPSEEVINLVKPPSILVESVSKRPLKTLEMEYVTLDKQKFIRVGGDPIFFTTFMIGLYSTQYKNYNQDERDKFTNLLLKNLFDDLPVDQWYNSLDVDMQKTVLSQIRYDLFMLYCRKDQFLFWSTCTPLIPQSELENISTLKGFSDSLPTKFPFVISSDVEAQINETLSRFKISNQQIFGCPRFLSRIFATDILTYEKQVKDIGPPVLVRKNECDPKSTRPLLIVLENEGTYELIVPDSKTFLFPNNKKVCDLK